MAEDAPERVAVTSTIERGRVPRPGSSPPPFVWSDVVRSAPPVPELAGGGDYVLYHGMEVDFDVRVGYTTRVGVEARPEGTPRILVESRISVGRRSVPGALDRIRQAVHGGARARRGEVQEATNRRLQRIETLRPAWSRAPARRLVRGWARLLLGLVDGLRDLFLAMLLVPDRVVTSALRAEAMLATRLGRRSLLEAAMDPRELTLEQRSVMILFVALAAGLTVLVLNSVFALVLPELAGTYRRVLADVVLMILGVLFVPVVEELMVVASTLQLGAALALVGLMVGKLVGVWIVYLLGTSLHDVLDRRTRGHPRMARAVAWMQTNADRHGFALLVGANAVPFVSGLALYPLAVAGIRFRAWMGGIAIGTAIRYVAIVAAILLVGPDRVAGFFGMLV